MISLAPQAFLTSALAALLAYVFEQTSSASQDTWVIIAAASIAPLVTVLVFVLRERSRRRTEAIHSTDRVSELTLSERQQLRQEAAKLREEERQHMERVVAGYVRITEIARKRSHILANAYMAVQLAHQELVSILQQHDIEIPEGLEMKGSATNLLTKLEEITEAELPPPSP